MSSYWCVVACASTFLHSSWNIHSEPKSIQKKPHEKFLPTIKILKIPHTISQSSIKLDSTRQNKHSFSSSNPIHKLNSITGLHLKIEIKPITKYTSTESQRKDSKVGLAYLCSHLLCRAWWWECTDDEQSHQESMGGWIQMEQFCQW